MDMAKDKIRGFNIEYAKDESGEYNFDEILNCSPVDWDEWITLPVRDIDVSIKTAKQLIRIPTVAMCVEYGDTPMATPKFTNENVAKRDGYVCQYSGRKLKPSDGNIDHVIPKDRGGRDSWENTVWCDKKINSMKGNRLNEEIGLKLLKKPKAPSTVTVVARFTAEQAAHRDWKWFLKKFK